jgi:hypothetical protein
MRAAGCVLPFAVRGGLARAMRARARSRALDLQVTRSVNCADFALEEGGEAVRLGSRQSRCVFAVSSGRQ